MSAPDELPHNRKTRLLHLSIALLVMAQVAISLVMITPGKNRVEDVLFELHEYMGIAAFIVIFLFWGYTLLRQRGTRPGLLFPWFKGSGRQALLADSKRYYRSLSSFKVPQHVVNGALPSAIHGLGILLIMLMTGTGLFWFVAIEFGDMGKYWAGIAKEVHEIFSNLVWAYLLGHIGMALINHFTGTQPLSDMWSVGKGKDQDPT